MAHGEREMKVLVSFNYCKQRTKTYLSKG